MMQRGEIELSKTTWTKVKIGAQLLRKLVHGTPIRLTKVIRSN